MKMMSGENSFPPTASSSSSEEEEEELTLRMGNAEGGKVKLPPPWIKAPPWNVTTTGRRGVEEEEEQEEGVQGRE